MLAKAHRLRNGRDINRVYSKGKYVGGGDISAKVLHTRLPVSRAVVVVGKKVSKKATVRNSLRRRVVAGLEGRWATAEPGYDIVITVHTELTGVTPTQLQKLVDVVLAKSGIFPK